MRSLLAVSVLLAGSIQEPTRSDFEWLVIYHVSLDNDLTLEGPHLLDALQKGVGDGPVAVTVLADFRDRDGVRRYSLTSGGRKLEKLRTEDVASEELLESYLAWAARTHPAKRYAVVFLSHGGDLDEMTLDEHPGPGEPEKWLSARKVGPLLAKFRAGVGGRLELAFFQQCGRASIDNLYNFKGAAAAVMASQASVGSPNAYYEPVLKWLAKRPEVGGIELAAQIMKEDSSYLNYVCVRGDELGELAKRMDAVVGPLMPEGGRDPFPPKGQKACYGGYRGGESNFDLIAWLEAAYKENRLPTGELTLFARWVKDKLVARLEHRVVQGGERAILWCGVSLFVPRERRLQERYKDYPLYRDSRLDELWKSMFGG